MALIRINPERTTNIARYLCFINKYPIIAGKTNMPENFIANDKPARQPIAMA